MSQVAQHETSFAASQLRESAMRLSGAADVLELAGRMGAPNNLMMREALNDAAKLDSITSLLAGGAQLAEAIEEVILHGFRLPLVVG